MNDNSSFVMLRNEWFIGQKEEDKEVKKDTKLGRVVRKDSKLKMLDYEYKSFVVYSLLLRNSTIRNTVIFNLKTLFDTLNITDKNTVGMSEIKNTLEKLNDNLLTIYIDTKCSNKVKFKKDDDKINLFFGDKKIDKNTLLYATLNEDQPKHKFFMVFDNEIDKILEHCKGKTLSKYELITYFSYICCSFNTETKVCYPSIEYISAITLLDESTILRYNKLLEEIGVLLIGNAGMNKKNNKYENESNIYARPEDKEKFEKELEERQKKVDKAINRKDKEANQDKQRSLKQKINKYKKGIDIDDITEQEWNELNEIEREYYEFVTVFRKNKIKGNVGFVTMKLDGENKKYYKKKIKVEIENDKFVEDINSFIKKEIKTPCKPLTPFDEGYMHEYDDQMPR